MVSWNIDEGLAVGFEDIQMALADPGDRRSRIFRAIYRKTVWYLQN